MPTPKLSSKLPPIPEPFDEDDEEEEEEEEEEEIEYVLQSPDGGWGWAVVASVFYCNFVSDGIMLSFGTFLQTIADDFDVDKASVALIGSLMYGVYLIMGPVCAGFSNVFGLRPVALAGSIISTIGLVISSFSPWYEFLYFSYGVLGGIGLGLIYMNGLIITALYFSRLRALAIGLTTTGTGFGSIAFPFVANFLLKTTTWRVAFLVEAGMAASMFFACLTFRPVKPKKIVTTPMDAVSRARSTRSRFGSVTSFGTRRTTIYVKRFPHTASIVSAMTMHTVAYEPIAIHLAVGQALVQPCLPRFWNSVKNFFRNVCKCKCECKCKCKCKSKRKKKDANLMILTPEAKSGLFPDDTASRNRNFSVVSSRISGIPSKFVASVSVESSTLYSRLDLPPKHLLRHKFCACEPLKRTVRGMLDCRVMKNLAFVVLCISSGINMSAFLIIMTYERDRAISMGFDKDMGTYFVMTIGTSNTLWRLLFGLIAIIPGVNNYYVCLSAMSLGGLAAVVSGLHPSLIFQFFMSFVMGFGMAVYAVFRPVILIELVGIDMIFSATGLILMIMGIASIVGPPVSGGLMLLTNNYNVVFYLAGSMLTFSGLMLLIIPPIKKRQRNAE